MTDQFPGTTNPMDALLDSYLGFDAPSAGEIRTGCVVSRHNNEVLVDIGSKSEGIIPSAETEKLLPDHLKQLAVGNEVRVYVVNPEDEHGNIILSYIRVAEEEDWLKAEKLRDSREIIQCEITGHNRGGVLSALGCLRAFIPASQLGHKHQASRDNDQEEWFKGLIGELVSVRVIESDRERGRLILSELDAERHQRSRRREKRMQELAAGEAHDGTVINLTDFGAFVDIGGAEGLIHTSELSWKHVRKASDLLSVGQKVRVLVTEIDQDRNRIALSLKRLEENPWAQIESYYQIGQLVEVTVTQLTRYGAFARINDAYRMEGLIHISELSAGHIKSASEAVSKGQHLTARIIRIDAEKQQIGFSVKQVTSEKYMESDLAAAQPAETEVGAEATESAELPEIPTEPAVEATESAEAEIPVAAESEA
jgi:small subunit ribosomal protein S1